METHCPLHESCETRLEHRFSASDLVRAYRRDLGIEVEELRRGTTEFQLVRCSASGLRFFKPAHAASPEFYETLESLDWYYLEDKAEFRFGAEQVEKDARILDIGCGAGAFSEYVRHSSYTGIDTNPRAVSRAIHVGRNVQREHLEDHLAHTRQRYTVISAFQILEHLSDPLAFLQSSLGGLEAGGKLIVSVPNMDSFIQRAPGNLMNLPPHHLTWWNEQSLRHLCSLLPLDLRAVRQHPLEDVHLHWYSRVVSQVALRRALGKRSTPALISHRFRDRFEQKLASKIAPIFRKAVQLQQRRPPGHTVTAVFVKRSA